MHKNLLLLLFFLGALAGDAILNVRKAKLIPSYELCIKLRWQGTSADGQQASGLIELPYVADENHDEDPELRVVLPVEDKASQAVKEAILAAGKQVRHAGCVGLAHTQWLTCCSTPATRLNPVEEACLVASAQRLKSMQHSRSRLQQQPYAATSQMPHRLCPLSACLPGCVQGHQRVRV